MKKKAPRSKRPTPADTARLAELQTLSKLTKKEKSKYSALLRREHSALLERHVQWAEFRDMADGVADHHAEADGRRARRILKVGNRRIKTLEPMAERGAKQLKQCIENAPKGGKSTAHYTDAEIESAFRDFKQRNPGKSAWDAANALIRDGKPLERFKRVTSPWNRIKRIANNTQGITREEWFSNL